MKKILSTSVVTVAATLGCAEKPQETPASNLELEVTKKVDDIFKEKQGKDIETLLQETQGKPVLENTTVTTYNPVPNQTDETPCVNPSTKKQLEEKFGNGDLCDLNSVGIRTVAVTQDRLKHVYAVLGQELPIDKVVFEAGEEIQLVHSNKKCTGTFIVADAFNARYNGQEKIDIFTLDPEENTKCDGAKVYLIGENSKKK